MMLLPKNEGALIKSLEDARNKNKSREKDEVI